MKAMRQNKKGMFERSTSYMTAVPKNFEDIMDPDMVLARLDNAQDFDFEVLDISYEEDRPKFQSSG